MDGVAWNHDMAAAPRDGTRVLLAVPEFLEPAIGYYSTRATEWILDDGPWLGNPPLAWMPIPPLPEEDRSAN